MFHKKFDKTMVWKQNMTWAETCKYNMIDFNWIVLLYYIIILSLITSFCPYCTLYPC